MTHFICFLLKMLVSVQNQCVFSMNKAGQDVADHLIGRLNQTELVYLCGRIRGFTSIIKRTRYECGQYQERSWQLQGNRQ